MGLQTKKLPAALEPALERMYSDHLQRVELLESLLLLIGSTPEGVCSPEEYRSLPTDTLIQRFYLSSIRTRIDRDLIVAIHSVRDSGIVEEAQTFLFVSIEKRKMIEAASTNEKDPLGIYDNSFQEHTQAFLQDDKQLPQWVRVQAYAIEMRALLKLFPKGSIQRLIYEDIDARVKEGINKSQGLSFLWAIGSYAMSAVASALHVESNDLVLDFRRRADKINETMFASKADLRIVLPVPSDFLLPSYATLHPSEEGRGAVGRNLGFFPSTIFINSAIRHIDWDPDPEKKLRQILVHETVHTTQEIAPIQSPGVPETTVVAILEGITEIETFDLLRSHGFDPWMENGMGRRLTAEYWGYQFLIRSAFLRLGNTNPGPKDYRFLLADDIEAVRFLAAALFGEIRKKAPEKPSKAGTTKRLKEQSIQELRFIYLTNSIKENYEELLRLGGNEDALLRFIDKKAEAAKNIRRAELEKLVAKIK